VIWLNVLIFWLSFEKSHYTGTPVTPPELRMVTAPCLPEKYSPSCVIDVIKSGSLTTQLPEVLLFKQLLHYLKIIHHTLF